MQTTHTTPIEISLVLSTNARIEKQAIVIQTANSGYPEHTMKTIKGVKNAYLPCDLPSRPF